MAKYPHQREHALALGADEVLPSPSGIEERYAILARALAAEVHRPEIGKPTVVGGADVTFDCVASATSIDDCLRFTTAGGRMVLVGMPAIPKGIDWTTIWYKELSVQAAYAYGQEQCGGRTLTTFELALELLRSCGSNLRALVGPPHDLRDVRGALQRALFGGRAGSIKTVFRITQ
jgi:threonine dehydrogenase-like Zn-dependent dehydrogenase